MTQQALPRYQQEFEVQRCANPSGCKIDEQYGKRTIQKVKRRRYRNDDCCDNTYYSSTYGSEDEKKAHHSSDKVVFGGMCQ